MIEITNLKIGMKAPEFCLRNQDGDTVCLDDLKGEWVVLYFYPKDNTPGCTMEAMEFSDNLETFKQLNAIVLGVSKDGQYSHAKFVKERALKITLLSDEKREVFKYYEAVSIKKALGITLLEYPIRTTYIIDPEGNIAYIWKKVSVTGHVKDVLNTLKGIVSAYNESMKTAAEDKPLNGDL